MELLQLLQQILPHLYAIRCLIYYTKYDFLLVSLQILVNIC